MVRVITKRFFLAASASFGLAHAASAQAPRASLRPQSRPEAATLENLVSSAQLGGEVAFAVADLRTGKILEEHQGDLALPPASTAKTITSLYALHALGPSFRFVTRLVSTGTLAGGILKGDLILVGGGDPTLNTDALAQMAAQLKQRGVTEVQGRFLYFEDALPMQNEIDPSQPNNVGYNPSISGLNLNFNRVHFEWKRGTQGYAVTMDARSKRYRPDVRVSRMKVAARDLPVYTYRNRGEFDEWTVAKSALGKGGARWLPVRKPGLYAAEVFQTFARSHGIVLKAPKRTRQIPAFTELVSYSSDPLTNILRSMLRYSTNLTAEVVGLTATQKLHGNATSLKASATHMSKWAYDTLGMSNARLIDHSGLGAKSRVTARDMARAMVAAERHVDFAGMLKPFAMRDAKRRVIKDHPVKVLAKTGTLNFVSALTGYATAPDGSRLAFAILCADTKRRDALKEFEKESPKGGRAWIARAKGLQQKLIERWSAVYG